MHLHVLVLALALDAAVPPSPAAGTLVHACVRDEDCALSSSPRPVGSAADCDCEARFQHRRFAAPAHQAAAWSEAEERICGPACQPQCCPPLAPGRTPARAACRAGACVVDYPAQLPATLDRECVLDDDCRTTQYPAGVADGYGQAYCPVCPRLARTATTQAPARAPEWCPPLDCRPTSTRCEAGRCILSPSREDARPHRVEEYAPLSIPVLPTKPRAPVPSGAVPADLACRTHEECSSGPRLDDPCGCQRHVMNRKAVERIRRERTKKFGAVLIPCPCNPRRLNEPIVCSHGQCMEHTSVEEWPQILERATKAREHALREDARRKALREAPLDDR